MHATVNKWGNSLALRLPKHIADELKLSDGATVELAVEAGSITIKPVRTKYTLAELLASEPPLVPSENREVDWGMPRGKEVW